MITHRIANIVVSSSNSTFKNEFGSNLQEENFNVILSDGSDLQKLAETSHPDLFLIDTDSHTFDGFEAAELLKSDAIPSPIPVVLLAKEKSDELYEKAIAVKADDVFIHTNDLKEFIVHIRPLLRLSGIM